MNTPHDFDVFLSHNSQDKPAVHKLKDALHARGLTVWFDEEQLRPGQAWQPLLSKGLQNAGSIIVASGNSGFGPWHDEEAQASLNLATSLRRPVIPVLLPGSRGPQDLNLFLQNRTWVDLRGGLSEDGIARLVWGITGKQPFADHSDAPTATAWILVAGSGGVTPRPEKITTLSQRLGSSLATAGFSLVTGGWDGVDHDVARAFSERIQENEQPLSTRLVQVMRQGAVPDFPAGRLLIGGSEDEAWQRSIERADAVVLVGGLGGTYQTGERALQLGKAVFPLADTRGPLNTHDDAYRFYFDTLQDWERNRASRHVTPEQFQDLAGPSPGVINSLICLLRIMHNG